MCYKSTHFSFASEPQCWGFPRPLWGSVMWQKDSRNSEKVSHFQWHTRRVAVPEVKGESTQHREPGMLV